MSKKEYKFIKPLAETPKLKPKAKVKTFTRRAVDEFIASGLTSAEVTLESVHASSIRGLMIGLGKAIGKDRKDKYEVRQTTDGKVVLIKKK